MLNCEVKETFTKNVKAVNVRQACQNFSSTFGSLFLQRVSWQVVRLLSDRHLRLINQIWLVSLDLFLMELVDFNELQRLIVLNKLEIKYIRSDGIKSSNLLSFA